MGDKNFAEIFSRDALTQLFPAERSDQFFEALYGDSLEGAYDISLHFIDSRNQNTLNFELHLNQRPGKCLACNLTYGLPEVFSRHPGINVAGTAAEIGKLLGRNPQKVEWGLGSTRSNSSELHTIPFTVSLGNGKYSA